MLGALFGGEVWPPQKFLPQIAQPFTLSVLADPGAGNHKIEKVIHSTLHDALTGVWLVPKNAGFLGLQFCVLKSKFRQRLGGPIIVKSGRPRISAGVRKFAQIRQIAQAAKPAFWHGFRACGKLPQNRACGKLPQMAGKWLPAGKWVP